MLNMSRMASYARGGAMMTAALLAASAPAAAPGLPLRIERQGSFQAGGRELASADGKATLHCDQGYVGFQIPVRRRKISLFLWHSSSAHVWEQRWDGGEGFQTILLRHRFATYVWDGPRVGRGNMSCEEYAYTPVVGQDQRNFLAWRFGPEPGVWFPGLQFPTSSREAYEQAMSARYVEFDIAKNAHIEAEAGARAIDRIGPSVALTNSAGDWRAMLAALRTDQLKGIVAYEPAAFVFPQGEGPQTPEGGFGPTHVPLMEFRKLTQIPIQIVWGDNIDARWEPRVALSRLFAEIVNRHGGRAEVLMLPSVGIRGNSHIPFADLNNAQIADQLFRFLHKHKLDAQ
jgi:hypothetical protein